MPHAGPELTGGSPGALLLAVTNPVDVVTRAALRASGLPPSRVIGTGTVLDGSRLRAVLARRCGVAVPSTPTWSARPAPPPAPDCAHPASGRYSPG